MKKSTTNISLRLHVRSKRCRPMEGRELVCFYYCSTHDVPAQQLLQANNKYIEPLFRQLKFLNCENIFKYLVGRLMYRVYHGELSTLQFLFVKNSDIHRHYTRQSGHYHIPVCRTNLGKSSLRYFGAWLWNKILSADINPNVSDFIFSRNLKTAIYNNLL